MSVEITHFPQARRLFRSVSQSWLMESLGVGLRRRMTAQGMRECCHDDGICALFRDVEIETVNRCNGSCSFCPVNASSDSRQMATMTDGLFERIISELSGLDYDGLIGLSSNNEPFIDKNIISRIRLCREACPKARLYLYTNGTLINGETVLDAIRAGLDKMVIDDYSDNLVLSAHARSIVEALDRPENSWAASKVDVVIRKRNEVLRNRAGRAPNKPCGSYRSFKHYADLGCTKPFKQLVIRPTGQVSLCCNDTLGEVTLGDVSRDGLLGVWNGSEYQKVRNHLLTEGRRGLMLCASCDTPCYGVLDMARFLCSSKVRKCYRAKRSL